MDQLSKFTKDSVEVNLLVIPIMTFWGKRSFKFNLPDTAYGEWIIYESGELKYYFNVFDKYYESIGEKLNHSSNIDEYLTEKFKESKLNLTIDHKIWGVIRHLKPFVKAYTLERLPISFLT